MKSAPTIIDCLQHRQIWAPWLEPDPSTRSAWFSMWKAMFGLPMEEHCLRTFTACTGRPAPAAGGYREVYLICGRRGGKSLAMAVTGVFLACFRKWKGVKGERLVVLLVAVTARQARSLFGYVRGLIAGVPALNAMVVRETQGEIDLNNGVSLVIEVADYRSIRGATIVAALIDEAAFITADGVATDKELLIAVKAGMISVPDAILIVGSTPFAKRGVIWDAHRNWYGKADAKELVWQAGSLVMNPSLDPAIVAQAMEDDPASARAEYEAMFRDDVSSFVDREIVLAAVVSGRHEIAPEVRA